MLVIIIPQKTQAVPRALGHAHATIAVLVAARPTHQHDCCSQSGAGPTQKSPAERSVGDEPGVSAAGMYPERGPGWDLNG